MKLSKEEVLEIALDFDNRVRRGMTIPEQIDFLVDNYASLSDDYEIGRTEAVNDAMQNGWNGLRNCFHPLGILFGTSDLVWEVYRPENLVGLSPRQLATLSAIGSGSWYSGLDFLFNKRYQTIVAASHILSPKVRALFCATRMNGWNWRERRGRFFGAEFERLTLRADMLGKPHPEFPRGLTARAFFGNIGPSHGLKLPQTLQEAILADDPARFAITRTMCNKQLSKNLILHLIYENAIHIILANFAAVKRHVPLDELAFFCVLSLNLDFSMPLLAEIDKSVPGTLRDARNIFGNNALWYLFYRNESSSHPSDDEDATDTDRIETLLLEHGCDPDQPNCLELTYNAIKAAARAILRDALWLCR